MAANLDDLKLPVKVDSFTLDRCIGAGAMGAVYHALEDISGRHVAVKIMARRLVGNVRAESRFRREITAMGQLRHPGIPAFAGFGELPDGRPYLAMELINGHTLDAFVTKDRPLPEDLALWVALQLAEVVGHCHRETGMIHRDLKPANVMVDLRGQSALTEQAQLRILDFGLATYIESGDFDDFRDIVRGYASGGTMAGEVMGTPAYMSPEQIRGERLGFQSDIYAIGAILYHLLTGRYPYDGSSIGVVMSKHLSAPVPDPSQIVNLRPVTVGVVQRAMAKTPAARFRSYHQLCAALKAARYTAEQATRRIVAPAAVASDLPAPRTQEPAKQPSTAAWSPTVLSEEASAKLATTLPTGPPVSQPIGPPTSTRWRRPGQAPPPGAPPLPSPALERPDGTSGWHRPVPIPPPETPEDAHEPHDAPLPPAPTPPPAPVSASWRRPKIDPPPAQPPPP